jgi:beta-lactamase superfamily II metal-dependent hydrolase
MRLRLLAIFLFATLNLVAAERTLDIYWIDVEGGASTLIVTPEKESVLIDSGWPWPPSAERIYAVATNAGLKQIDYLVTTHFHVDHFGGAAGLSKLMPIKNIWDNGAPPADPDSPGGPFKTDDYKKIPANRKVIRPLDEIPLKASGTNRLVLRVLATRKEIPVLATYPLNPLCSAAAKRDIDMTDNARSVCLLLNYNGFKFFDAGDMTWNVEGDLVCPFDHVGKVDLYQVTHHGMDISNNPLLLKTLAPTVAVMNNGPHKGGSAKTVKRLRETPSVKALYQLHRDLRGKSEFNTEDKFIANMEEKCAANFIKCSVDSSESTYTLSIPATAFSEKYITTTKPQK